jgi:hypothetical protein
MIFPEIMAEMRRPRDFIKGMAIAQLLIIVSYPSVPDGRVKTSVVASNDLLT